MHYKDTMRELIQVVAATLQARPNLTGIEITERCGRVTVRLKIQKVDAGVFRAELEGFDYLGTKRRSTTFGSIGETLQEVLREIEAKVNGEAFGL